MMKSYTAGRFGRARVCNGSRVLIKPSNRIRPNNKALAALFLCAMLLSSCVAFVVQTPLLAVREVRVRGVRFASKNRVEQSAGLALGRNIFLIPSQQICRSISAIPEVSTVRLERHFPSCLMIKVVEHKPLAAILINGKVYLVQSDGYVFHVTTESIRDLPLIRVDRPTEVYVGARCKSKEIVAAIKAVKTASENELQVAGISIDRMGDMCLNMCGGLRVKLGQPDSLGEKIAVLRSALICKPALAQEAVYIDVTCPKFPVYRPKSGGV